MYATRSRRTDGWCGMQISKSTDKGERRMASKRKIITSDKVFKPTVPLSHAVKIGNVVWCSGITPFGLKREMAPDFAGQMHAVMKSLTHVLEEAGSSLDRVAKVNVIL